jgi:hypothetical protein
VDCTEEEHQANRRTEFLIIKMDWWSLILAKNINSTGS